jgi:hypothetical protein
MTRLEILAAATTVLVLAVPAHAGDGEAAGKVVFGGKAITTEEAGQSAITLGAPLFMSVFSEKSPAELAPAGCKRPMLGTYAVVNGGEPTRFSYRTFDKDEAHKPLATGLDGNPATAYTARAAWQPANDDLGDGDAVRGWNAAVVPQLIDGKNTVEVVVRVGCWPEHEKADPVIARGTLELTTDKKGLTAYLGKYGPQVAKAKSSASGGLARHFMGYDGYVPGAKIVGFRTTASDWHIERDGAGRELTRSIDAMIVLRYDGEKLPGVCGAMNVTVCKDPGEQAKLCKDGRELPFPCANAPK